MQQGLGIRLVLGTFSLKAVEFSLMPLVDMRDEVLTLLPPPPPKLEDTRDVVLLLLPPPLS